MSASSRRKTTIIFAGDVGGTQEHEAAYNTSSPAASYPVELGSGANTITKPTNATCVTIVKASDNTTSLTFKGVAGDTGVRLHDTDPDSITLHSSVTTFVLTTGAAMTVRLVWS